MFAFSADPFLSFSNYDERMLAMAFDDDIIPLSDASWLEWRVAAPGYRDYPFREWVPERVEDLPSSELDVHHEQSFTRRLGGDLPGPEPKRARLLPIGGGAYHRDTPRPGDGELHQQVPAIERPVALHALGEAPGHGGGGGGLLQQGGDQDRGDLDLISLEDPSGLAPGAELLLPLAGESQEYTLFPMPPNGQEDPLDLGAFGE